MKDLGGEPILESVSLALEPGSKTALVGRNGAGKTTLVRILLGQDDDFRGTVIRTQRLKVGYVPQHVEPPLGVSALGWLLSDFKEERARLELLEQEMGESSGGNLERVLAEYGSLREAYEERAGDNAEDRALRSLDRSGLAGTADREAARLSGWSGTFWPW